MRICGIPSTSFARFVVAAAAVVSTALAAASPMVYTANVVTDVKVGSQSFHNALVSVSFYGDTKDIVPVVDGSGNPVLSWECSTNSGSGYAGDGSGYFFSLSKGFAIVKVTSKGNSVVARLNPGQIFVALDACNGGIGFGAFTGPSGLEVAYPIAFTLGTAMGNAAGQPGSGALTSTGSMSGNAWSCIGYPPGGVGQLPGSGGCAAPDSYPLHSDHGDVFVYQTNYSDCPQCNHDGTLNRGTFTIAPFVDD